MKSRQRQLCSAAGLILSLVVAMPGVALADASSMDEAAAQIKEQHPGCRVLKADHIRRDDGASFYRLRVLTRDGTVKTIRINSTENAGDQSSGNRDSRKKKRRTSQ